MSSKLFLALIVSISLVNFVSSSKAANNLRIPANQNSFADVVELILPAVVNINILNASSNREYGSGFLISPDGYVVTNNHVIDEASEIIVTVSDNQKFKAKILGIDKKTDLALLKIESDREFKFVKFGNSQKSRIGDWVLVVGNPFGLGSSVSTGIISAKGRSLNNGQIEESIQTDAAINNGNSGGPMFNLSGEVIGVSTSILSTSGGNIGIGFAIPANIAEPIIRQLKDKGEVVRGWIGVSVQDVNSEIAESLKVQKNHGAFVTEVIKNGPADQAGLIPTDIILKIDDAEINNMKALPRIISRYNVGRISKFTISRRGVIKTLEIKVAKLPEAEVKKTDFVINEKQNSSQRTAFDQISGLSIMNLSPPVRKLRNIENSVNGVLVTEVVAKSEAAERGISAGDIILSVNQEPVNNVEKMRQVIEENSKNNQKHFLLIKRGSSNFGAVLSSQ